MGFYIEQYEKTSFFNLQVLPNQLDSMPYG